MTFRPTYSLDGEWRFWIDPDDQLSPSSLPSGESRIVTVPAPWQSQSPDLRYYTGAGWYRRRVEVPEEWLDDHVILGFGAVDYRANVWINDIHVGDHEGGYLPFEFDVTHALEGGTNTLTVRVTDPPDLFPEVPHGKQSWYGPLSGIWQSVWLERRSPAHIKRMHVSPELHTGEVHVTVILAAPALEDHQLRIDAVDTDETTVASAHASIPAGTEQMELAVTVSDPQPWSPDQPYLYTIQACLGQDEQMLDTIRKQVGFRTIEARDGRLYLNGEPFYLRGALDQDYYPETIATPPSVEFLEDQVRKAKELGLNCLRCHIKVPDPRYYEVADRLGMLVWTELPNWQVFTEDAAERGRATLKGILERDGHHPSIIAWTIINEDWGTELVHDTTHRVWVKETYRWLKELDPTRLVVDNSPCYPNFHVETDLEDYHFYRGIPDHRRGWDEFVTRFASRLDRTFSPYGDAVRSGQEPLVVSEFGNWGLPDVDDLLNEDGTEPWWFETGIEWDGGVVYPHGVRERFRMWHLDKVFANWQAFVEATQWQEYRALKYQIEAMRRRPEIAGYVITELTDVHWECNGLLDMQRNPKVFHQDLSAINADTVIIPSWERVVYWAGEEIRIDVAVAHGAGATLDGTALHWSLGSSDAGGRISVPTVQVGQVESIGTLTFRAPTSEAPGSQRLNLELRTSDGRQLATNTLEVAIFPQREDPTDPPLLWTSDPKLAHRLDALGYPLASDPRAAETIVTRKLDTTLMDTVRAGGSLLVLADHPDAIEGNWSGIQVQSRAGTSWNGDWASSFAWVRRDGPFTRLPGGPLIDHSFDRVIPRHVLTGFRPWAFEAQVYAGLFVGWIHKPAALIAEQRYGSGKVVLTTFRLHSAVLGTDPTATTLFDALIELSRLE